MILRIYILLSFIAFGLCVDPELTRHGLPEYNVPVLDPLFYDYFHISYNTREVHVEVDAFNSTITGFVNIQFLTTRTYLVNDIFRVEIDAWLPEISLAGIAKVFGTVGPFRLNNTGYYNVTATDINVTWSIWGPVVNDRWIIEHFRMIPTVKNAWIKLQDFTNSKEIDNLLEDFGNEFWPSIYRATEPIFFGLEPSFIEGANNFFEHLSFSKVFPE